MDSIIPIVVAVVAVVITSIVLLWFCLRRGFKGRTICLVGLSNSGKTLLYMRLIHNNFVRTQTSMKENKATLKTKNKKGSEVVLEVVDIPGNERLRNRTWRQYIDALLGVIIVIDSVNFPQETRDLAHLVIEVLSEPIVHSRKIPILFACNKQDLALAISCDNIHTNLENEITQISSSPSVQLDSLDQTKELKKVKLVSSTDKEFSFSSLANPVEFISCSARGKGDENNCTPEIDKISKWLNTVSL